MHTPPPVNPPPPVEPPDTPPPGGCDMGGPPQPDTTPPGNGIQAILDSLRALMAQIQELLQGNDPVQQGDPNQQDKAA